MLFEEIFLVVLAGLLSTARPEDAVELPLRNFSPLGQASDYHDSKWITPGQNKMLDGQLDVCESTDTYQNWIMLTFVNLERYIVTEVKIAAGNGQNYMKDPIVYLTDTPAIPATLDQMSPTYRLCGKQSGTIPSSPQTSITCDPAVAGIYIVLWFDTNSTSVIDMCLITAFGKKDTNVALNKPVGMSSNPIVPATMAVDGVTSLTHPNCAHGSAEVQPFLWVDLQETYNIEMVRVMNRDIVSERLGGLKIYVKTRQPDYPIGNYFNTGLCAALGGVAKGAIYNFPCVGIGNTVVLYISNDAVTYLTVCELEVYVAAVKQAERAKRRNFALYRPLFQPDGVISDELLPTDGAHVEPGSTLGPSIYEAFLILDLGHTYIVETIKMWTTGSFDIFRIRGEWAICQGETSVQGNDTPALHDFTCESPVKTRNIYISHATVDPLLSMEEKYSGNQYLEIEVYGRVPLMSYDPLGQAMTKASTYCLGIDNDNYLNRNNEFNKFSAFTDGNKATCQPTITGQNWIMLSYPMQDRFVIEEITIVTGEGGFSMTNPIVYLTDSAAIPAGSLDQLSPKYRLCGKYSGTLTPGLAIHIPCDMKAGTHVIIQFEASGSVSVCEISAAGYGSTNVALNQPAQFNTGSVYSPASLAVDGITSQNYNSHNCAHTRLEVAPYFYVNLEHIYDIEMVRVVNRGDAVWERLTGLLLYVKSEQPTNDNSYFDTGLCASLFGKAQPAIYSFPCFGRGKFVVAKLHATTYFTICELEVYVAPFSGSSSGANIALGKPVVATMGGPRDMESLTDGELSDPGVTFAYLYPVLISDFYIDLKKVYLVTTIKTFASGGSTIGGATIGSPSEACAENATMSASVTGTPNVFDCPNPIRTRIIHIRHPQPSITAILVEVEVYGDPVD